MGSAKHAMERGWLSTGKFVCADCLDDDYLKSIVRDHQDTNCFCSYCDNLCAAPVDTLVPVIEKAIKYFMKSLQRRVCQEIRAIG